MGSGTNLSINPVTISLDRCVLSHGPSLDGSPRGAIYGF